MKLSMKTQLVPWVSILFVVSFCLYVPQDSSRQLYNHIGNFLTCVSNKSLYVKRRLCKVNILN